MRIQVKIGSFESEAEIGLGFLGELVEITDLSIEEIYKKLQKNPFKMVPTMLEISLKYTAEEDGESFDLSRKDLLDLIEKDGGHRSPGLIKFLEDFNKHFSEGVPEEEENVNVQPKGEEGEDPKKK